MGAGYGYGYGPYWGFYPNYYNGFYGNGLSMYGPPVPTYKPIPGVFGGGDSQFFGPPPIYPGWVSGAYIPLARAIAPASGGNRTPPAELPVPAAPAGQNRPHWRWRSACSTVDSRLFVDGAEVKGAASAANSPHRRLETTGRLTPMSCGAEWGD